MTNIVTVSGYKRFEPVGQSPKCKTCPSYCKTSCARLEETDNHIDPQKDFQDFHPSFSPPSSESEEEKK